MKRMLKRIWRSPVTTVILGILFVLSFSSAVFYHVKIHSADVAVIEPADVFVPIAQEETNSVFTDETVQAVQVSAVDQRLWAEQAVRLLQDNVGQMSAIYTRVYTSKPVTAVTFEGVGSMDEAERVISVLRAHAGTGTFFFTQAQIQSEVSFLTRIIQMGQQVGILVDFDQADSGSLMCDLLEIRDFLQTMYAYAGIIPIRPVLGAPSEALCECASALGWPVVLETIQATPEEVWRQGNPEIIAGLVFPANALTLQRGGIANFQLGAFTRDEVLGDYLRYLIESRNASQVTLVTDIIADPAQQYIYPLPDSLISMEVREAIAPGQTTYANVLQRITNGYIGLDGQNKESLMPGFTYLERDALNKTGMVRNENDQVFLTFEGWGSDVAVQNILGVLEKHNAHATFFIKTEDVPANPNLVRAIAAGGHDIGTRTHTDKPVGVGLDSDTRVVEINETEADELRQDIVTSYNTLMHICGDMTSDSGKPSLTAYFRPPGLLISRRGLEVVFDLGFKYCILGSYDCEDDKAKSVSDLANAMRQHTQSGSVLILRMSDDCPYTAEALDSYLTRIEMDKHYRFVGLSMALR